MSDRSIDGQKVYDLRKSFRDSINSWYAKPVEEREHIRASILADEAARLSEQNREADEYFAKYWGEMVSRKIYENLTGRGAV